MQRRLFIAVVGTAAVALLLASTVTLALVRRADRNVIQQALEQEADVLVSLLATASIEDDDDITQLGAHLTAAAETLDRRDVAVLLLDDAAFTGDLPHNVQPDDLRPLALAEGGAEPVSGIRGSTAWAAATGNVGAATVAVVMTDPADQFLSAVLRWFAVSAALSLALGAAVAVILSRRLARPLRQARDATQLIADGDLSARVPSDGRRGDEITDLSASINEMAESLERSYNLEHRFLMSISHDLHTPLTSIRGYGEAIADDAADDNRRAAEIIVTEAIRLERLLGDLLDLARLDTREFPLDCRLSDVAAVAREACAGFAPSAAGRGVDLRVTGPGPVTAWCDPGRVAQVVSNLIQNALKFARSEVLVECRAHSRGDHARAVITVDDDGPGISEEDRSHVFDRLYVARYRPQPKESGSGLGLAIVAQLTEAMGGRVRVAARRPAGTRFTVELPADPNTTLTRP